MLTTTHPPPSFISRSRHIYKHIQLTNLNKKEYAYMYKTQIYIREKMQ